jgi:hypothetical protein
MPSNPLTSTAVVSAMADALPTHKPDDVLSDLTSSLEAIALLAHACMINVGFRLVGLREDKNMGEFVGLVNPTFNPTVHPTADPTVDPTIKPQFHTLHAVLPG